MKKLVIEGIPIKDFKHRIKLTKEYNNRNKRYRKIEIIDNILYTERMEMDGSERY